MVVRVVVFLIFLLLPFLLLFLLLPLLPFCFFFFRSFVLLLMSFSCFSYLRPSDVPRSFLIFVLVLMSSCFFSIFVLLPMSFYFRPSLDVCFFLIFVLLLMSFPFFRIFVLLLMSFCSSSFALLLSIILRFSFYHTEPLADHTQLLDSFWISADRSASICAKPSTARHLLLVVHVRQKKGGVSFRYLTMYRSEWRCWQCFGIITCSSVQYYTSHTRIFMQSPLSLMRY